jgi:hypothetical protein
LGLNIAAVAIALASALALVNTILLGRLVAITQRQIDVFTRTMACSSNPEAFAIAAEIAQVVDEPVDAQPLEVEVID